MFKNKKDKAIFIPQYLYEKIKKKIEGSDFNSVSDYVVFVLKEVLETNNNEENISEKEKIKERLKALGYMD